MATRGARGQRRVDVVKFFKLAEIKSRDGAKLLVAPANPPENSNNVFCVRPIGRCPTKCALPILWGSSLRSGAIHKCPNN
jgi:hypothetical protein